jgi:hypothetical protein
MRTGRTATPPPAPKASPVFTSDPVAVDGAGGYASGEVVFEQAGTYYWIETLLVGELAGLEPGVEVIELTKDFGETQVVGRDRLDQPPWVWPKR